MNFMEQTKEMEYNVMITGPADHGLYMIQSLEFNHHPAYT